MRIAVAGHRFAGKTSLSCCLSQRSGFYLLNYTDVLKRHVHRMLQDAGKFYSQEDLQRPDVKERLRKLYIATGEALGFYQGWGVDKMIAEMTAQTKYRQHFVFDNVRFQPQWELLKPYDFVLVRVEVPYQVLVGRAAARGVSQDELDEGLEDSSEQYDAYDILLDGTRPVEDNADILCRLAGLPQVKRAEETRQLRSVA